MNYRSAALVLFFALGLSSTGWAQFPGASEEHKLLKQEEGVWDAEVTMFMGPAGAYDPPTKSKAKETNRMLGDFWLVTDFQGKFEGTPFTGLGRFGYDPKTKKYVGEWVDSFGPHPTKMVGSYDAVTKTLTYETASIGMDGNPYKGKNVVVYGDNSRSMTMYAAAPGTEEMIKVMEIVYKRAK